MAWLIDMTWEGISVVATTQIQEASLGPSFMKSGFSVYTLNLWIIAHPPNKFPLTWDN